MKKILLSCVIACIALSLQASVITTTTFVLDDFKRSELGDNYTMTDITTATINTNVLSIGLTDKGRAGIFGNTTMSGWLKNVEADSLVWMVNMRYKCNIDNNDAVLSGFNLGNKGFGVIIAGSKADIASGNGYAIIHGGNEKQQFRLAKYTNGVNGQGRFMDIIAGTDFTADAALKHYFALRVVYIPATNTWRFYDKDCGKSTFTDPASITDWNFCGEAVDDTHTSNTLNTFFFLLNGTSSTILMADNFSLMAYNTSFVEKDELVNEKFNAAAATLEGYNTVSGAASLDGALKLVNSTSNGRNVIFKENGLTGWLKKVEADSIIWLGNFHHNNGQKSDVLGGFNAGKKGLCVVLAGIRNDKIDAGSGYAVIYGGNEKQQIRLVKYANGLNSNDRFTDVVLGQKQTNGNKLYFHFKVVYIPSTNTWKFYEYTNENNFKNPANLTDADWTFNGEAVDNTHTSKELKYFGFLQNYLGSSTEFAMTVQNFSLTSYLTKVTLSDKVDNSLYLSTLDKQVVNVSLDRTLSSASYNTICVPFNMTGAQIGSAFGADCEVVELTNASLQGETLEMEFTKVDGTTGIKAGKPYLIKPTEDIDDPVLIKNVTIDNTIRAVDKTYVWFSGTFSPKKLTAGDQNVLFLGAANTLYWPSVGGDNTMNGFRCYFKLKNGAEAAKTPRMVIRTSPTDMPINQSVSEQPVKVIENGRLVIQKGNVKFNIMGQQL